MRLRGVSVGGRLPAKSATGTVTGESWPCVASGARTSIGGWCARDGRSRTGTTRWTMYPTSGRHELRSGGCGVVTSCRLGGGGRVSGSRAVPPSPGRVPVAVAGSRGTSAARECGSTMFRVVSRTTRLGSIPRRASGGSALSPRPGRRGGGRRGGNLARRPLRKFLLRMGCGEAAFPAPEPPSGTGRRVRIPRRRASVGCESCNGRIGRRSCDAVASGDKSAVGSAPYRRAGSFALCRSCSWDRVTDWRQGNERDPEITSISHVPSSWSIQGALPLGTPS